ncbi:MAG TPA: T9SS type A sorting domain-containing protein [Leeuwenhoekiella sp.]|nr:T9SS type A sorting domain-containing protein [Leeuwenhoekiella sp.]
MKTITQLFFLIACSTVGFSQSVAYIDFGSADNQTEDANYNNVTGFGPEEDGSEVNLINSDGEDTGITLLVDDAFNGLNTGGSETAEDFTFPATATGDSFYGSLVDFANTDLQTTGGFTLSGLDAEQFYSFSIFASRDGATENRSTLYTIQGAESFQATLNPSDNTTEIARIENVQASETGTITFTAQPGADNLNLPNQFYYLGAIELTISEDMLSVDSAVLNNSLAVYPNPVSSQTQITFDLQEQANLKIDIYDLSGRLVENIANGEQPAGKFTKTWNRSSNIAAGVYILQIDADGKRFNSKLLLK